MYYWAGLPRPLITDINSVRSNNNDHGAASNEINSPSDRAENKVRPIGTELITDQFKMVQ